MAWRRGQAYSQDLRSRVLASADEGDRVGAIAAQLRVSVSYVSKVLTRRERTGIATARPQRGQWRAKLAKQTSSFLYNNARFDTNSRIRMA